MQVLILESGTHPRHKCCAGGLLERALNSLGELPDRLIERELDSFIIARGGTGQESIRCNMGRRVGVTLRREEFDAHLVRRAESAGTELVQGTRAISAREHDDHVEVRTDSGTLRSRFLVVATGSKGRLADHLLGPRMPGTMAMGSAMRCVTGGRPDSTLRIHLFDRPSPLSRNGFPLSGASFPLGDGFSVSVVADHARRDGFIEATDSMVELIDRDFTIKSKGRTCFHPVPMAARPSLCSSRSLVVGDAAGFVSPFSGEGLTYALMSAELASIHLKRASDGVGSLIEYQDECRRRISSNMVAAGLLDRSSAW
jgi:flavin-dependent dehydrogenase